METYNLVELTRRESGALMWDDGTILIVNWADLEGLPRVFAGSLVGSGDWISAEQCEAPEIAVTAMQEHESEMGYPPSTDGYRAWRVYDSTGACTVVVQRRWN